MQVNRQLLHDAHTRCGGGRIHQVVQIATAYEFAVVRANHPKTKDRAAEHRLVQQLEEQLYQLIQ